MPRPQRATTGGCHCEKPTVPEPKIGPQTPSGASSVKRKKDRR